MSIKQDEIRPIRRHPALVSYSREHHTGLQLVWKIRTGHKKAVQAERIASYVVWAFENDLAAHFSDEEQYLAPYLESNHPFSTRLFQEHAILKEMVEKMKGDPNAAALQSLFANTLEKHIRFEERELFNFLQENLSVDALKKIEEMERSVPACSLEDWQDVFWM